MTSPHILCIMSHYTDPALSLRRGLARIYWQVR